MERGTCQDWLQYLDELDPVEAAWRDADFVRGISWALLMFVPRRMCQRLIDAGEVRNGASP